MDVKEFKVIQCKDHIYISEKGASKGYYGSNIPSLLFDGVAPEKTYKDNWFKLSKIPEKVEKKLPDERINIRYELKEGYTPSDLMPQIINLTSLYDSEYEEVSGLYQQKYDVKDGGFEEIEFSIEVIYKKDDFEWIKVQYASNPDLISGIEFHPDLLQEAPCKISSEEMYGVIRNYVKTNINPLVAKVTSDYDFHFEVKKSVAIAEPYSYSLDLNSGKKRSRPNWVQKWVSTKEVTILNLKRRSSDSNYGNDCVIAPTFFGKNQLDLEDRVNTYLKDLIDTINKEYIECPHCKGWGVIEKENHNG
jgi:hypothetical protein